MKDPRRILHGSWCSTGVRCCKQNACVTAPLPPRKRNIKKAAGSETFPRRYKYMDGLGVVTISYLFCLCIFVFIHIYLPVYIYVYIYIITYVPSMCIHKQINRLTYAHVYIYIYTHVDRYIYIWPLRVWKSPNQELGVPSADEVL